jgi:hypothetical protein
VLVLPGGERRKRQDKTHQDDNYGTAPRVTCH